MAGVSVRSKEESESSPPRPSALGKFPSNDDDELVITWSGSTSVCGLDPIVRRPHHSGVGAVEWRQRLQRSILHWRATPKGELKAIANRHAKHRNHHEFYIGRTMWCIHRTDRRRVRRGWIVYFSRLGYFHQAVMIQIKGSQWYFSTEPTERVNAIRTDNAREEQLADIHWQAPRPRRDPKRIRDHVVLSLED